MKIQLVFFNHSYLHHEGTTISERYGKITTNEIPLLISSQFKNLLLSIPKCIKNYGLIYFIKLGLSFSLDLLKLKQLRKLILKVFPNWNYTFFKKIIKQTNNSDIIIFHPTFFLINDIMIDPNVPKYLNKIRGRKVLYFIDSVYNHFHFDYQKDSIPSLRQSFDLVLANSKEDCEEYNLSYMSIPGWNTVQIDKFKEIINNNKLPLKNVSLVSTIGKKVDEIFTFIKSIDKHNISANLKLLEVPYLSYTEEQKEKMNYILQRNNTISNNDISKGGSIASDFSIRCAQSNCQVQINVDDAEHLSTTHLEAIQFNKKILTNAKCIIEEPFFDEEFIRIIDFNKPLNSDDIMWLKTPKEVQYNQYYATYAYFIEKIINMLSMTNESHKIG